ncbi:transcriptional regulator, partial [Streptomyces sp. NRRL WC-3753]
TKAIPIIFLTGTESDSAFAFRGYSTGAADYLTKPFDPWVLRAKVNVFLDLHRKNRQLRRLIKQDNARMGELADRISEIERRLSASDDPGERDLSESVARMAESVRSLRRGW